MFRLRSFINGALRTRSLLRIPPMATPMRVRPHSEGPLQPFDNMPFSIPNRHVATIFFAFFFGLGFYAPFIIVWYSMAKKTL